MSAHLRKYFLCLFQKNSSYICKSSVCFSTPLHFYSTSNEKKCEINPEVYDYFLHKHHFSPEAASKAASALTCVKNPENSDSVLSFFKEHGFSNTHLEKIVTYRPSLISVNLDESIKPKINIFQGFGFSNDNIANIIASNASILYVSVSNRIIPSLSLLRGLLGSNEEVVKLVMRCGWFLTKDLERTMLPNIELLESRSVGTEQIMRCMYYYPRLFLKKPEYVRNYAEKAEKMGVKPSSKMYIHAVRAVGSMSDKAWEVKLHAFRNFGFSEDDILNAFKKCPTAFAVSVMKMKKVKEVLVSSGKYDIRCIVNNPIVLLCSIEKRYKPRMQILAILESKKVIKKWPSVTTLSCLSNNKFYEMFVGPYMDEVGHLFAAKSG